MDWVKVYQGMILQYFYGYTLDGYWIEQFCFLCNINSFGKAPNGLKPELILYLFPQPTDVSSNLLALDLSQIIPSI